MAADPDTVLEPEPQTVQSAFQRYRAALAKAVARIVKPHEIEDILQETFLRIYQAAQRQTIRHPKPFMLKAARNIALNHVMRADAMNHLDRQTLDEFAEQETWMAELGAPPSLEREAQDREEFLLFCRAVRELPLQCRRVFILKKVYGLSQREVAQQLGLSEATVEKHIVKGLMVCSAYMEAHGYGRSSLRDRTAKANKTGGL